MVSWGILDFDEMATKIERVLCHQNGPDRAKNQRVVPQK